MPDHPHVWCGGPYGWGQLDVKIVPDPAGGKPILELTFPDGCKARITTNIGELIGGAASGVRQRHEAQQRHERG